MRILYNQIGYKINDKKIAYLISNEKKKFLILDENQNCVFEGESTTSYFDKDSNLNIVKIDFSNVKEKGLYLIKCDEMTNFINISDYPYKKLYVSSINYLENSKCGIENIDEVFFHKACHTHLATIYGSNKKINVTGGLHDAGDYGRYVVPGCKVILDLLFSYLINKDKTLIEIAKYEIDWLLKMQRFDGAVYHKVTGLKFPSLSTLPENETDLYVFSPSTQATGDFVAAVGLYAYILKLQNDSEWEKYYKCIFKSYQFLINNGPILFKNPNDCITGEYDDKFDIDERFVAKAAMYLLTKNDNYLDDYPYDLEFYKNLGWADVGMYGVLLYKLAKVKKYDKIIVDVADMFINDVNGFDISLKAYPWGSNMIVCNNAIVLGYAYKITKDLKYRNYALSHLNYILGSNQLGKSFITKFGSDYPKNPHHRLSISKGNVEEGMLVGGPFENLVDDVTKIFLTKESKSMRYIDHVLSYSTNEVCIYWNSPLIWLLSLIK